MKIKLLFLLLTFIGIKKLHSTVLNPPHNGDISTCGLNGNDYHRMPTLNFVTRCSQISNGIFGFLDQAFLRCTNMHGLASTKQQMYYDNYILNMNQMNEDERHGKPNGEAAKRKAAAVFHFGKLWWGTKVQRNRGLVQR